MEGALVVFPSLKNAVRGGGGGGGGSIIDTILIGPSISLGVTGDPSSEGENEGNRTDEGRRDAC